MSNTVDNKTIKDFAEQWQLFQDNEGYFASLDLFQDSLGSLVRVEEFKDKIVIDLGSGTGRFVRLLHQVGAVHIHAVEPADSFEILRKNTKDISNSVTYHHVRGDEFSSEEKADFAVSMGVVSYIPDPGPSFKAIFNALKPGGKFVICLMAYEGNEFYLSVFGPIRVITKRTPNILLYALCEVLNVVASLYALLCKFLPLPLKDYALNVFSNLSWRMRRMIIFDQLNPTFAKYYRREEIVSVFEDAGFRNVKTEYRHGYSWVVLGTKM